MADLPPSATRTPERPPAGAGVPRVRLLPSQWEFDAPARLTVLQAALAAGIELPNSCRNGTCRSCLCRLRAGTVRYAIEWPGVSLEERQDGYFLPCVSHAETALVVEQSAAEKINVT